MVKSFKYRLRPTKKQEQILLAHIDECRILYNQLLCARIQAWKNENKSLSQYDQTKTIPLLKQQHSAFKQVYSQVLQQVSQRVDLAFKGFFRRLKEKSKTGEKAGFPRYKNENRYDSITYPQFANGCRLDDKGLRLGSIGCIRIVQHRSLEGIPKSCTITRTATGKSISCDIGEKDKKPNTNSAVGIDVGLNSFAVTSDGQKIENQRFFRKEEKGSCQSTAQMGRGEKKPPRPTLQEKGVVKSLVECMSASVINDITLLIKTSRKMVNRHGFIAVEKLDVKEMQKEQDDWLNQ